MVAKQPTTNHVEESQAGGHTNGYATPLQELDASKLIITRATKLKPLPDPESLIFGATQTDHMLVTNYTPTTGWSAPHIKPYAPLELDPMASCFHYCPNVFEGMKAYVGPDGKPRLFRPKLNMARLARSAARVALPEFDQTQLLILIKKLIQIEARWIPTQPGYSLYIRPTVIGTRPALGVHASDHAMLYVLVSPSGPYFKVPSPTPGLSIGEDKPMGISLLAVSDNIRAWPGGTGGHKLGLNYAPGFLPQKVAKDQGYDQILWLFKAHNKAVKGINGQVEEEEDVEEWVTEVGAMNFFLVVKGETEGSIEVVTPNLDGTILPGITRTSTISLLNSHAAGTLVPPLSFPSASPPLAITSIKTYERALAIQSLFALAKEGRLLEAFGVGTAAIVAPIHKIGWKGKEVTFQYGKIRLGPIGSALSARLGDIQTGKIQWEDWSERVDDV